MKATKKLLKTALLGLAMTSIGACQHTETGSSAAPQVMRNTVQMVRLPFEVTAELDGTDSLSSVTIANINGFLSSVEVGYGDILMLDGPEVSGNRVAAIASLIKARGLVYGGAGAFGPTPKDGSVILYVERYLVTPPNCNYWPHETSVNTRNNDSAFHGCASTINLGLMVADPRDLVSGRSSGNSTAAAVSAVNPTPAEPASVSSNPLNMFQQMFNQAAQAAPTAAPASGNQ